MAKRKAVNVKLLRNDGDVGEAEMYSMLSRLIEEHHEDLTQARIALAWNLAWQTDVDGRLTLGKCKRASDLDREFSAYDFVILLNADFWQNSDVTDAQRRALLDHELCHGAVKLDKHGEPLEDERGRTVYRIRKHDIEEFSAVVARHGCYKRDLERFAAALRISKQYGLDDAIRRAEQEIATATGLAVSIDAKFVPAPRGGEGDGEPMDDIDRAAAADAAASLR